MLEKAKYKLIPKTILTKELFEYIVLKLREQYGINGEVIGDWYDETITINVHHDEIIDLVDDDCICICDVQLKQ